MIDDVLIKAVTEIVNARIHKKYPMLGEEHFSEAEVKIICESFLELAIKMKEKK